MTNQKQDHGTVVGQIFDRLLVKRVVDRVDMLIETTLALPLAVHRPFRASMARELKLHAGAR
jgi:hypothetical protein